MRRPRVSLRLLVPILLGVFAFAYRFVDPEGPHGGLSDDHFFYVIRGWQMLFGQLPVRDYVDPGAPLAFALSAAVQWLDRGTVSEMALCAGALAIGAALTCRVATEASNSLLFGTAAGLFQVSMFTRYYSYPKVLVYAVAIPALWAYATRRTTWRLVAVALVTAVAFLLRHDHGVFVAAATATLLLVLKGPSVGERLRAALVYGACVLVLLAPYFLYLSRVGGIMFHARTAMSWSERDRGRAPLVLPGFTGTPDLGSSDEPRSVAAGLVVANSVPWTFYTLELIPVLVLFVLLRTPDAFRPGWPEARAKVATVAVLAIVLNVGFLRGALDARFADVSVPQAVLGAWLALAVRDLIVRREWQVGRSASMPMRVAIVALVVLMMGGVAAGRAMIIIDRDTPVTVQRVIDVANRYRPMWPLSGWTEPSTTGSVAMAFYLERCTLPSDFIFVQPYLPQIVGLAHRPFAGGHGDLRPGFFNSEEHQRLTIARLDRQPVPVAIVSLPDDFEEFRKSFPLIASYMDLRFRRVGTRTLPDGMRLDVLVDRRRPAVSTYEPLDLPCFR